MKDYFDFVGDLIQQGYKYIKRKRIVVAWNLETKVVRVYRDQVLRFINCEQLASERNHYVDIKKIGEVIRIWCGDTDDGVYGVKEYGSTIILIDTQCNIFKYYLYDHEQLRDRLREDENIWATNQNGKLCLFDKLTKTKFETPCDPKLDLHEMDAIGTDKGLFVIGGNFIDIRNKFRLDGVVTDWLFGKVQYSSLTDGTLMYHMTLKESLEQQVVVIKDKVYAVLKVKEVKNTKELVYTLVEFDTNLRAFNNSILSRKIKAVANGKPTQMGLDKLKTENIDYFDFEGRWDY